MSPANNETLASDGVAAITSGSILLVVGVGHLSTHPFATGATISIGRDASCDVTIDHPKVSRRHALVIDKGGAARVEDAGGTNRVKLGERSLASGESVALTVGASFQVGPFTVMLLGLPSPMGESVDGRAELVVRDVRTGALTDLMGRVAESDVSVLIRGETGTGKDVLARALHRASGRPGPFVAINCASLNEGLLESELFGHERGAFTGAVQAKPGLFEAAQGGTIFLDEVAELPASVQAKLLRAIETRQVTRLGGVRPIDLEVRFLAATHRDLREAVADGEFRQDLYYRINGVTIVVIPLRDRKDSIPVLAQEFLTEASARSRRPAPALSMSALTVLARHDWPGNVRELKTVVERALLLTAGTEIESKHIVIDSAPKPRADAAPDPGGDGERERLIAALDECAGNQTRAAKKLGISRATLAHKLALLRIPRPRS